MTGDKNKTKGFALFYAIIIMGAVSIILFSITAIILQQTKFSIILKNSQQALFAANSGLECALYWDLRHATFPAYGTDSVPDDIGCLDFEAEVTSTPGSDRITSEFEFDIPESNFCVKVLVDKKPVGINRIITSIESFGRSNCNDENSGVERAIRTIY